MTGLLTKLTDWINGIRVTKLPSNGFSWEPCSFECYDDGGCDQCSALAVWEDPDYGQVEAWWGGGKHPAAYLYKTHPDTRVVNIYPWGDTQVFTIGNLCDTFPLHKEGDEVTWNNIHDYYFGKGARNV